MVIVTICAWLWKVLNNTQRTMLNTEGLSADLDDPAMSPDGQNIAVVQSRLGRYAAILVMHFDGSNVRLFDESPTGNNLSPLLV
jgi:Tol biopolymer transport system component